MVEEIKNQLSDKKVDLEAGDIDLSTVGFFWKKFLCISPKTYGKSEIENGGRIVLPASSLEVLYSDQFGLHNSLNRSDGGSPMIFEISSSSKRSFCGVVEFSAEEGTCCVPNWMMRNLVKNFFFLFFIFIILLFFLLFYYFFFFFFIFLLFLLLFFILFLFLFFLFFNFYFFF